MPVPQASAVVVVYHCFVRGCDAEYSKQVGAEQINITQNVYRCVFLGSTSTIDQNVVYLFIFSSGRNEPDRAHTKLHTGMIQSPDCAFRQCSFLQINTHQVRTYLCVFFSFFLSAVARADKYAPGTYNTYSFMFFLPYEVVFFSQQCPTRVHAN